MARAAASRILAAGPSNSAATVSAACECAESGGRVLRRVRCLVARRRGPRTPGGGAAGRRWTGSQASGHRDVHRRADGGAGLRRVHPGGAVAGPLGGERQAGAEEHGRSLHRLLQEPARPKAQSVVAGLASRCGMRRCVGPKRASSA
jgi:hypothetical protein